MQTGSRVSCIERLWALREERGQPDRAGRETESKAKRERVISPHPASFSFKHESQALHLVPPPLPFLSSSIILPLSPFDPSITYSLSLFFLSSWLVSSHLQPHLQYRLRQSNRGGEKQPSWSELVLQLKDKSVLKHKKLLVTRLEFLGLFRCFPFQWFNWPKISWHYVDMFLESEFSFLSKTPAVNVKFWCQTLWRAKGFCLQLPYVHPLHNEQGESHHLQRQ